MSNFRFTRGGICVYEEEGGVAAVGDYCLSCVDQIISVIRIYVLVIAFSPPPTHPHCLSLSNAHPRGQLSVRVILYILCGKGQRGALRLTPSLPREKVWCSKNQRKTTASRLAFTQRAVRSIPSACLPLISGCTVLRDSLLLLLITVQCITATWYSSFPSNYKDNLQNLD